MVLYNIFRDNKFYGIGIMEGLVDVVDLLGIWKVLLFFGMRLKF